MLCIVQQLHPISWSCFCAGQQLESLSGRWHWGGNMTHVGPLFCLHFEHPVTWMLPHRYGKVGMKYHLNISFEEPPTCLPKKNHKNLHRPGIEPGPPAWQASILPLNQRCLLPLSHKNIHTDCNFMFSAVCSCGRVVKATHSKWVSLWERRFESYQLRIEIFLACCNLAWNAQMSSHSNVPLEACETMWPNG